MFKTIKIIVMAALCLNISLKAQEPIKPPPLKNQALIGKVIAATTGETLPGAVVKITNTNQTVLSNNQGEFILTLPNGSYNLSVSYLSHKTKNVSILIPLKESLLIALEADDQHLQEVQINAGYYTVKERERTGSISRVDARTIARQPVSNPLQALQGRMAGVQIQQFSGFAGGGFSVSIRGQNSLRANGNAPLYIIDGVPFVSTPISSGAGGSIIGDVDPLSSLNPGDIEAIEVLKDADGTAIYGSRGANGVVLITTKKGKAGLTRLEFNAWQGTAKVPRFMEVLNTSQYLEMRNEAFSNDGASPQAHDYDINGSWDKDRFTNWQKALIGKTAHSNDIQLGLTGGDQQTKFLLKAGRHKETTVLPGNLADLKYSALLNLSHSSPNNRFNANISISYLKDDNRLVASDPTSKAVTLSPNAPEAFDAEGRINWANGSWDNPYASFQSGYLGKTKTLVGNVKLNYQLLPRLKLITSIGYTTMGLAEQSTTPIAALHPNSVLKTGFAYFSDSKVETWIAEPQLEYAQPIGKGNLTILVGSTLQQNQFNAQGFNATGYTNDSMLGNIKAAGAISVGLVNNTLYKYQAVFGRINYNWADKYLLNLTGRRDGSSRFGPGKQFANFAAIGAAWVFTAAGFVKNNLPFLSFGKLRTSYGVTGSDQIGDYGYYDLWQTTAYGYNGNTGLYPTHLYNPEFGWERNYKFEAEISLRFLNDRLSTSLAYYSNSAGNQLVGFPLPATTGFNSIQSNLPAKVQNKGLEIELTSRNIEAGNWKWSTSFNISFPENKLIRFPGIENTDYNTTNEVGKSLYIDRSYRYLGLDAAKGIYLFEDKNKDGNLNPVNDYQSIVERSQKYYGGLQNTFGYKGLELTVFFQFVKQTGHSYMRYFGTPGFMGNQPVNVLNRWQKAGDVHPVQKFTQSTSDAYKSHQSSLNSDRKVADASYIRLKNVSLSYQLPARLINQVKLQNMKIYFTGQNLITFTRYIGLDPETQNLRLPPLRTLTLGLQFTF